MRGARELDRVPRLVADDPGVVARRDLIGVAGHDVHLGPVVHLDVQRGRRSRTRRGGSGTSRSADERLDVMRPAPARLADEAADGRLVELDDVDPAVLEAADLVRRREAPALESRHDRIVRNQRAGWLDLTDEGRPRPRARRPGRYAVPIGGRARRPGRGVARPRAGPPPAGGERSPSSPRRPGLPTSDPTLDAHLAGGLRVAALGELVDDFVPARGGRRRNPRRRGSRLRAADPPAGAACATSTRSSSTWATMWSRRGGEVPEAWYRLPIFYFSNISEIRGLGDPVWAPIGSSELDFELEVCALVDAPARDLASEGCRVGLSVATRCSTTGPQGISSATRRSVRLGPAKGKDFASTIGPWLVTPDERPTPERPVRPVRPGDYVRSSRDGRVVPVCLRACRRNAPILEVSY